jgi:two-component system chemotaxis response regulator CheB
MPLKKIKVLVVDDSAFMRLLISDIISSDDSIEVLDTAENGKEAAEKVAVKKPDLVLLDLNMGEYDGLYAVKRIMNENPVPILILSSVGNTNLEPVFDALRVGAVDYINKPDRVNSRMRAMNEKLVGKIKQVVQAKPKVHSRSLLNETKTITKKVSEKFDYDIIVIGASTGGPTALEVVINTLPEGLNIPIIICQHMPDAFIAPFVNRLNSLSPMKIVVGEKGMSPVPGMIIVAPGTANMILTKESNKSVKIDFNHEKYPDYNNPSINALMLSAAEIYGSKAIGVILTGMGKDGVKGLKAIKDKGGLTIAQNKESSVIYGMPKVAVEQGAVKESLHVKEIGNFLVSSLRKK